MSKWQPARLIPTWGIKNDTEAEMRAASTTLAVLSIVRDFSSALLTPLGASSAKKATVETFIEVAFKLDDGTVVRPDGLIRVTYGKNVFTVLVEVKTGDNQMNAGQVNAYWEVARKSGFDAVLTISNELGVGGQHPTDGLKVRANSKVQVHHYSWMRILTTAVMCKVHRGVDDPEQAWILAELIRYLENPSSGAMKFTDMGPNWVVVRDSAKESALHKNADECIDIAHRWDQLMRYAALRLLGRIGAEVVQVFPRSQQDPRSRLTHLTEALATTGTVEGTLKVPNAIGLVNLEADLRARRLVASVDVPAPTDRGSRARTTWLLRQLGDDVPPALIIQAWPRNARTPITTTIEAARENRDLLDDPDGREILRYRLLLRSEMGAARKSGGKSPGFVDSVVELLDQFYELVVQDLTAWVPKAPQVKAPKAEVAHPQPAEMVEDRREAEEAMDEASAVAASAQFDATDSTPEPRASLTRSD